MPLPPTFLAGLVAVAVAAVAAWVMLATRSQPAEPVAPAVTTFPGERLPLWPGGAPGGDGAQGNPEEAFITVRLPKPGRASGTAFVICPGGGYGRLSLVSDGHNIAAWLEEQGIAGVVLEYRMPAGRAGVPGLDAARAMRTVRARAAEWGIDPKRLGIIGLSAGGHLAATILTHSDGGNPAAADPVERFSSRPDFGILVYPVISMGPLAHAGSRSNLLGPNPSREQLDFFSCEKQVTEQTPPVYLAHALDDATVSAANSAAFRDAMLANQRPVEYLELHSGGHGLNHFSGPMWEAWQKGSLAWLASLKLIPAPLPKTPSQKSP